MKIMPLKGVVVSISDKYATVKANKGGGEYKFNASALSGARENDEVDLLIKPSEQGVSEVVFIKPAKKIKPIKFAKFSTLLLHMQKTLDRLKATLAETDAFEQEAEIKEKIDWLIKGIELFS